MKPKSQSLKSVGQGDLRPGSLSWVSGNVMCHWLMRGSDSCPLAGDGKLRTWDLGVTQILDLQSSPFFSVSR